MARKRIDQLLVERGFAGSRQKAQALLLAGRVLVDGQKVEKAGQRVEEGAPMCILGELPYVSRAGGKLQAALDCFQIVVEGRVCADLGASTGGFTDCLLQKGARRVFAFDVGKGQLDWKLQTDPRVTAIDRFNVRHITARDLPGEVSLVVVDLSFISLTKILPALAGALEGKAGIDLILLVKPQFEAGKAEVGKGGVVRDSAVRERALRSVAECALKHGFSVAGSVPSPVAGAKGNREFLLHLKLAAGL